MTETTSAAAAPSTGAAERPVPPRRSPLRRILKIGVIFAVIMVVFVLSIPTLLSTDFVRGKVQAQLSEALGTDVRIGSYSLGWFSGAELHGVVIKNPEGFDQSQNLFELRSMKGDVSLRRLLGKRVDVEGEVVGLQLRIVQKADGRTNVAELGAGDVVDVDVEIEPGETREFDIGEQMARLRLDLKVRDSWIEIVHEQHGVLERLDNIDARIHKEFDARTLTLKVSTELSRPGDTGKKGNLQLAVEAEADPERPILARLACEGLDLSRYRPVLAMFVPPGDVTAFAGIVNTRGVEVSGVPTKQLEVGGELTIDQPHFAGPLFADMDIRAPRWTLKPNLTSTVPTGDELPVLNLQGLSVDLGFLTLEGLPTEPPAAGQPQQAAGRFALDLDTLASFGGSVPAELRGSGSRVEGEFRLPLRKDYAEMGLAQLIEAVRLDATLTGQKIVVLEQAIEGIGAKLSLDGGKLRLDTTAGCTLGGGALSVGLGADLTDLEQPPVALEVGVRGASVVGGSVQALQYAVPLLAGLANDKSVDFQSKMNLRLKLSGPGLPREDEPVLEWLDDWSGDGNLGLLAGSFTPAGGLQQLLTLTGQPNKLSFRDIATDFVLENGFVQTGLMKLSAKGREFGIQGKTSLGGAIDYVIDVKDMLKGRGDADKLLEYLGDQPLGAKLVGSLAAPQLALPDIGDLIQKAALGALQEQAGDLIKKEAGKILDQRAGDVLEGILGGKKKDGDKEQQQDAPKKPEEQAVDLLRGLLGGKKKQSGEEKK